MFKAASCLALEGPTPFSMVTGSVSLATVFTTFASKSSYIIQYKTGVEKSQYLGFHSAFAGKACQREFLYVLM